MYRYALSVPSSRIPNDEWITALKEAKLKRIEFSCAGNCMDPQSNFAGKVRKLKELQDQGYLNVGSIHIPFGGQWVFGAQDPAMRKMIVQRHVEFLHACQPLGTRNFTIHGGCEPYTPENRQAGLDALADAFEQLIPTAQELGISLNLELLPRTCLANKPQELYDIVKDYPEDAVGVCLDVNHLNGTPELVPDAIRLLGKRLRAFHFSDYDGIDECHWFPFLGVLPWDRIMAEIKKLPQDLIIILETDGFLKTPAWQQYHKLPESAIFNSAAHNIYLLEHADEVISGIRNMVID